MDRSVLYERWLDDLQLYLDTKRDLDRKVKAAYGEGDFETDQTYWQEYETLETLREISRRALDEYVGSAPSSRAEPEPRK